MKLLQRSFVFIKMSLILNMRLNTLGMCSVLPILIVSFYILCPFLNVL